MNARLLRVLIVLAGLMGAGGVILAAASAHGPDASRLGPASSMLLFHAAAVLGTVALAVRGLIHAARARGRMGLCRRDRPVRWRPRLRQFAGHALFPFAAPTGGTLLIASWLALAVAAAWPKRRPPEIAARRTCFAPCAPIG